MVTIVLPFLVYIVESGWSRNRRTIPDLLIGNLSVDYEYLVITVYT